MKYKPRTTKPDITNKYYINYKKSGYCTAIIIDDKTGSVIYNNGNCVGYAQARFREIQSLYDLSGSKSVWSTVGCKLAGNAKTFYPNAKAAGMRVGQVPKVGAIVCWGATDGAAGHVAIVEEIKSNGDIVCSESGYNAFVFKMNTYYKSKGYVYDKNRPLQGFIYQYIDFEVPATVTNTTKKEAPKSSYITYKVVKGDSLWVIAQKYLGDGRRYPEIKQLNNLKSDTIYPNQVLKIPNK